MPKRLVYSFVVLMLVLLALPVLTQNSTGSLKDLDWLAGTWKQESSRRQAYETWNKVSPVTFEGVGFSVTGGDTSISEYLRLEQFGDEIFYTARVSHNPFPVPFKLVEHTENTFTFENNGHDFPQRIIYRRKSDVELQVRVEGKQGDNVKGFDMPFKRQAN